jgi:hypothetical protein
MMSNGWTMAAAGMLTNRATSAPEAPASRSLGGQRAAALRARRTNDPLAGIDTNTARGRRTADLVRAYLASLGNPAEIERQAAAIAAAELQVLAEEARATALKEGASADLDRVVRMQGAADRALKRLGIKAPAPATSPSLSPAAYLAGRAGLSSTPEAVGASPDADTHDGCPQDDGEATAALHWPPRAVATKFNPPRRTCLSRSSAPPPCRCGRRF